MKVDNIIRFKQRLNGGVLGCFAKTIDSSFVEAIGYAGLDFVILDMEHGPIGFETLKHLIIAAENSSLIPVVRLSGYKNNEIGKALDLGAAGVQIPSISLKKEAEEIVSLSKFFPDGNRGVCRFVRAAHFGIMDRSDYFKQSNETLIVLQLEGKQGLKNFDEIVSVNGIDIIFIGPYDLSQSLGVPGKIEHPLVLKEIEVLIKKADKQGVILGTFCDTFEQLRNWKALGIKYLAYSVDVNIFIEQLLQVKMSYKNGN